MRSAEFGVRSSGSLYSALRTRLCLKSVTTNGWLGVPAGQPRLAVVRFATHSHPVAVFKQSLVFEMPSPRKNHRNAILVRRRDHFGVLHAAPRLNDGGDSGGGR